MDLDIMSEEAILVSKKVQAIQDIRTSAKEALQKQADKMSAQSSVNYSVANVGDNIVVKIPDVDRTKADDRNQFTHFVAGSPIRINITKKIQNSSKNLSVFARQIFDSRGNPTVEVDLITDLGLFRAAVPSGASTGVHEALELRDEDGANYHGKGVLKAVGHVNQSIGPALLKQPFEVTQQREIDEFMLQLDGTENKSKFGANAILGVSLAVAKAGAAKRGIPLYKHLADLAGNKEIILPVPAFNVINGGSHAGNKLAMQEFMILPTGAHTFSEAMKMGSEVYHHLKSVIKKKFGLDATAVGDEGGFAPNIQNNKEALQLISDAIAQAGYTGRIDIGMDVAASEFYKNGKYDLDFKNAESDKSQWLPADKLQEMYQDFIDSYPIVSIEDPFDQDHWDAWSAMTAATNIQIVGDDLTVTNPRRIQTAVQNKACNCLLLKVNQIEVSTIAFNPIALLCNTRVVHMDGAALAPIPLLPQLKALPFRKVFSFHKLS
ncbi:hypothetical protein RN001_011929 [Aquatica leii]|uniref:Enolase n=1 Tax=Aquatica leii TaxID=1421715 RepID=A0AAN7SD26_9COLE|nr:hypothetical protein RN001_011929 [Aquatica leii]